MILIDVGPLIIGGKVDLGGDGGGGVVVGRRWWRWWCCLEEMKKSVSGNCGIHVGMFPLVLASSVVEVVVVVVFRERVEN